VKLGTSLNCLLSVPYIAVGVEYWEMSGAKFDTKAEQCLLHPLSHKVEFSPCKVNILKMKPQINTDAHR
jgi:hypothetical protein